MNKLLFSLSFFAAINLANPAYAYLDPGTGSIILQLLLGGVAGALLVSKLYWHRLKSVFRRGNQRSSSSNKDQK